MSILVHFLAHISTGYVARQVLRSLRYLSNQARGGSFALERSATSGGPVWLKGYGKNIKFSFQPYKNHYHTIYSAIHTKYLMQFYVITSYGLPCEWLYHLRLFRLVYCIMCK